MNAVNFKNIAGEQFGRYTAIEFIGRIPNRVGSFWRCLCQCGEVRLVTGSGLRNKTQTSCGCLADELAGNRFRTHGLSKTKGYRVWCSMRNRCTNPNNKYFPLYGGRGITVCQRWTESYENFLADMGLAPPKSSLDRIDNDGPYSPENCRWTTRSVQTRNTRKNRLLTHNGVTQCVAAWAESTGLKHSTICARLDDHGWTVERTLSTPLRGR